MSPGPTGSPSRTPARSSASRPSSAPTTTSRCSATTVAGRSTRGGRSTPSPRSRRSCASARSSRRRRSGIPACSRSSRPRPTTSPADASRSASAPAGWRPSTARTGSRSRRCATGWTPTPSSWRSCTAPSSPGRSRFSGTHYTVEDLDALPKPIQQPHPPLIVGGSAAPRGARLGARWADEYNFAFASPEEAAEKRHAIHEACRDVGRDPVDDRRVAHDGRRRRRATARRSPGARRQIARLQGKRIEDPHAYAAELAGNWIVGTPDEAVARLREYEAAGIERVFLQHLLHRDLDAVELLAREVIPAFQG